MSKSTSQRLCYLCNKPLGSLVTDKDHILPHHLFSKGDEQRPYLYVHKQCNNLKSKEDEWFVKQIQLRSSLNKTAESDMSIWLDKAILEKPDAYLIGKKLHNYKLAKGMFENMEEGLNIVHDNSELVQLKLKEEDVNRFNNYVNKTCKGLFIYHNPNSKPGTAKVFMGQYQYQKIKGQEKMFDTVNELITNSKSSLFGRKWGDKILYVGSRTKESENKGFVFVQFYSEFGVLAFFR